MTLLSNKDNAENGYRKIILINRWDFIIKITRFRELTKFRWKKVFWENIKVTESG
jgi:hypothetical protein